MTSPAMTPIVWRKLPEASADVLAYIWRRWCSRLTRMKIKSRISIPPLRNQRREKEKEYQLARLKAKQKKNGWKCLKEKKKIKWEEFEFDSKMEPKNPIIKSNRDGRQQKKIEKDTEDDPWRLICR